MKLVVKECGEPAHGTAEFALVLEGWPANVSKERAQQYADYINKSIAYMVDIDDQGRPCHDYRACYDYERRTP